MKNMSVGARSLTVVGAIAFTMLLAHSASAAVISFSDIVGTWSNVQPPNVVGLNFTGNGTGDATVKWGTAQTSGGQSGYEFQAPATQPVTTMVPPSPSGDFIVGTFTHINETIALTPTPFSITGVTLTVAMDVNVDGTDEGTKNFVFDFLHDETDNSPNPCPFGGANGQGVNINGCADRVRVTSDQSSQMFTVGGVDYTVTIAGFQLPDGTFTNQFLTEEAMRNPANLLANVTAATPPCTQCLEPGSLVLLGTGLIGLVVLRRRHGGLIRRAPVLQG